MASSGTAPTPEPGGVAWMASFWRPHSFPAVLTSTNSISSPRPGNLSLNLPSFPIFFGRFYPRLALLRPFSFPFSQFEEATLFRVASSVLALFFYSPLPFLGGLLSAYHKPLGLGIEFNKYLWLGSNWGQRKQKINQKSYEKLPEPSSSGSFYGCGGRT